MDEVTAKEVVIEVIKAVESGSKAVGIETAVDAGVEEIEVVVGVGEKSLPVGVSEKGEVASGKEECT